VEPRERIVPSVYVFSSKAGFATFTQALGLGSTENTLGYYSPTWRILCFYEEVPPARRASGAALSGDTMETLLHETFHQWLALYVKRAPHWFNEGLAEYFGFSEITPEGLRYGLVPTRHPSRLDNLRQALTRQNGLSEPLPLRTLLRADRDAFMDPAQCAVNYAHAWSVAHFLGASRGGRKLIKDYFLALRDGKDLDGAFDAVFAGKIDLEQLEREWRAHVDGLR
jgi:hypothetical protein